MYNWERDAYGGGGFAHANLITFGGAAALAVVVFLAFSPQIDEINGESAILINVMFGPAMAVGVLYGMRITAKAVTPSETRSPVRRSIVKVFLFFFVIGGLFSSVSFALNGGSVLPVHTILEMGLFEWATDYISTNGGATFLIVASIALMAAATRRLIDIGGRLNRLYTFTGTFIFFSMLALSFTQSNPSDSQVYLFTFYQAGIIGGALYEMNKLTKHYNNWEDYQNGY